MKRLEFTPDRYTKHAIRKIINNINSLDRDEMTLWNCAKNWAVLSEPSEERDRIFKRISETCLSNPLPQHINKLLERHNRKGLYVELYIKDIFVDTSFPELLEIGCQYYYVIDQKDINFIKLKSTKLWDQFLYSMKSDEESF